MREMNVGSTTTARGQHFEVEAKNWLSQECPRLRWLAQNFRKKFGEIDLIAEEDFPESENDVENEEGDCELVLFEVRGRLPGNWMPGVECVDWRKRQRLERIAADFLSQYAGPAQGVRFDLVTWDGNTWSWIKNAWVSEDCAY